MPGRSLQPCCRVATRQPRRSLVYIDWCTHPTSLTIHQSSQHGKSFWFSLSFVETGSRLNKIFRRALVHASQEQERPRLRGRSCSCLYCSRKSHLRDSNPGLQLYESCALPTELRWLVSICLVPAAFLKKSGAPPGESGTLLLELRRRHRSKFLTYRRGAKSVKIDQPGWNVWPSMDTGDVYLGPRAMARW